MHTNTRDSVPFGIQFEETLPAQGACEYEPIRQDHGLTLNDMKVRGVEMASMGTGTGTFRDRDG